VSTLWNNDVQVPCRRAKVTVMTAVMKRLLEEVENWPPEDQEELAQFAREIQERRAAVYALREDERSGIERGLDDIVRADLRPMQTSLQSFARPDQAAHEGSLYRHGKPRTRRGHRISERVCAIGRRTIRGSDREGHR